MDNELTGLSPATAGILHSAGLNTRKKVSDAGEIAWLKLPMFGRKRMNEVNAWLGRESPATRRAIEQSIRLLESHGYVVKKPSGAD